jgi:hypothetical protein
MRKPVAAGSNFTSNALLPRRRCRQRQNRYFQTCQVEFFKKKPAPEAQAFF